MSIPGSRRTSSRRFTTMLDGGSLAYRSGPHQRPGAGRLASRMRYWRAGYCASLRPPDCLSSAGTWKQGRPSPSILKSLCDGGSASSYANRGWSGRCGDCWRAVGSQGAGFDQGGEYCLGVGFRSIGSVSGDLRSWLPNLTGVQPMSLRDPSREDLALRAQLLAMPLHTPFNVPEASLVTGLSPGALANRRAAGMWPHPEIYRRWSPCPVSAR